MKWQNILLPPAYWNRWPMAQYSCKMSKRCLFSIHSVSTTSPYRFDDYHAVWYAFSILQLFICAVFNFTQTEREREGDIYLRMNQFWYLIFFFIVFLSPTHSGLWMCLPISVACARIFAAIFYGAAINSEYGWRMWKSFKWTNWMREIRNEIKLCV